MAEQRGSGRKGVPHHPLVKALASDPSQPPKQATKLFGYPGPAADKGSTRLWLDSDLTSYVDVPDDSILHSQTLPDDQGTYLWVEPQTSLAYASTSSHEVQADFLGGSIAAGSLGSAAPATGTANLQTAATLCRPSLGFTCTAFGGCVESAVPHCPTVAPVCGHVPSTATICPTVLPLCGPPLISAATHCPTVAPMCPILSAVPHCPTVAPVCGHVISAPGHCPTVSPRCPILSNLNHCPTRPLICGPFVSGVAPCLTAQVQCHTAVPQCIVQTSFDCPTLGGCPTGACTDPVGPFRPSGE